MLKRLFYSLTAVCLLGFTFYLLLSDRYYDSSTRSYTDESFISGPINSLVEIENIFLGGTNLSIWDAILNTLLHFSVSFMVSIITGIIIGVIIGVNRKLFVGSEYILNFFRVLPSIVFITIFKYQMQLSANYVYYVGIMASIWPIIINTRSGVARVNPTLRESIKILKIPKHRRLYLFTLPEAAPDIFTGIKISLGISFLIAITCEYLFKDLKGLGSMLNYYEVDCAGCILHSMFIILIIGFIGIILGLGLDYFERKSIWLKYQFSTLEDEQ